jgi:DNA-binding beta-propeller fold protein YncE
MTEARARRSLARLLAAAVLFLVSASVAWALGELSQKAGTAGCVSETGTGGGCQNGKALEGPWGVTASPDGKSVYVASAAAGVAVFDRTASGALSQKSGIAGCVSDDGLGGLCRTATALAGPFAVEASSDGRNVYVASVDSNAVTVFDRDPATGALTQKADTAGCISDDGTGGACQNGAAIDPADVAASPDGKSVYAVSLDSNAVDVFDRDQATGELSQKTGTAGCVSEDGSGGACQDGAGLVFPRALSVSADGKSVYVASAASDSIAVFDRDPATGALAQKQGTAGCVSGDGTGGACRQGTALDLPFAVTVSADGKSLYVASHLSNAVAVFDRDPASGALAQKPGRDGCVSETGDGGACRNGSALVTPAGVAASPDGTGVYVTSHESDAVAAFDRDPATGALTPKPGNACVSETGTGACQDGAALDGALAVAASADGTSVYVTSIVSNAIAIFDRATPSPPPPSRPPAARSATAACFAAGRHSRAGREPCHLHPAPLPGRAGGHHDRRPPGPARLAPSPQALRASGCPDRDRTRAPGAPRRPPLQGLRPQTAQAAALQALPARRHPHPSQPARRPQQPPLQRPDPKARPGCEQLPRHHHRHRPRPKPLCAQACPLPNRAPLGRWTHRRQQHPPLRTGRSHYDYPHPHAEFEPRRDARPLGGELAAQRDARAQGREHPAQRDARPLGHDPAAQ